MCGRFLGKAASGSLLVVAIVISEPDAPAVRAARNVQSVITRHSCRPPTRQPPIMQTAMCVYYILVNKFDYKNTIVCIQASLETGDVKLLHGFDF